MLVALLPVICLFSYCALLEFKPLLFLFFFFFFQAEDGIRDADVTGVQTCALPIYLTLILIGFLTINLINAQEVDLSNKWINSIETSSGFNDFDKDKFDNLDFSSILSNQLRFDNDPISTYIGVFGPNYRRIDFHFEVTKNELIYSVTGKSKLGNNVRELKGEMKLKKVLLREQEYITDSLYIGLFDCKLFEPGDRDGDGVFSGIFTLVFY